MRTNTAFWPLGASVTIGLACALAASDRVRAEPVLPAANAPNDILADWTRDAASDKDAPEETRDATREHLSDLPPGERANPAASSADAFRSLGNPRPQRAAAAPPDPMDAGVGQAFSRAVKETIRPAYDEIVELGVVETLRAIKSELGLNESPLSTGANSAASRPGTASQADAGNAPWDPLASQANSPPPPRTASQQQADRIRTTFLVEALIAEIKPWVYSALGLYALIYVVKWGWTYNRRRTSRRLMRDASRQHRPRSRPTPLDSSAPSANQGLTKH